MAKKNVERLTLDEIKAQVNKKSIEETGIPMMVTGSEMQLIIPRISTGILSYDLALGGGWAKNQANEIVGPESSGKTATCFNAIAHQQKDDPDHRTLYVAAEEYVPSFAQMFGVNNAQVEVLETNAMETAFEVIIKAAENRAVDLIVIDSLPALVTEAEGEKSLTDGLIVSPGARIIGTFFKKWQKASRRSLVDPGDRPITMVVINQWRDKIGVMFGDPRTTPGGKGKDYYFFTRTELGRQDWIQEVKSDLTTRIGQTVAARTIKNKTYRPQQRAEFDFYFADGGGFHKGDFDVVKDVVNVALALDIFESPRYTFEGEKLAGKKEDLYLAVREQPRVFEKLWDASMAAMLPHLIEENIDESDAIPESVGQAGDTDG